MKVHQADFFKKFVQLADDGYKLGWHERNGGNLSYRMTVDEVESIKEDISFKEDWLQIGTSVPELAGEFFVVTGSGKYFRNIINSPDENCGIIEIDITGSQYRVVWGLLNESRPTSELPSHLMNHEVKKRNTFGRNRIIYHAHTTNIIALTFVLPLDNKVFTRYLWEMATECPVVFPEGVGVVPWMVPGGRDIGVESSLLMEKHNVVIWAHHGTFCAGDSFDDAFGLMHTVEKSAEILIKVFSSQKPMIQTITPQNFRDLGRDFNVSIDEEFLFERELYNE